MPDHLVDQAARDRFRLEWNRNFVVSANAGSGKTTAVSERLAELALAPGGADLLRRTAVVTFTRKAAAQIGQRSRAVLQRRLAEEGHTDFTPLDHLERAFTGTIHSFCLLLAQRHGQLLGINLNPTVVESTEREETLWEEFLEQDSMQFSSLDPGQVEAFLRHTPLASIFGLARDLGREEAQRLLGRPPAPRPPEPSAVVLQQILDAKSKGSGVAPLQRNKQTAVEWRRRFREETSYLPFPVPQGKAAGIVELYAGYFAQLKSWLAAAGGVLAAELALRYRRWRAERGVQTYADQIEAALAVLRDGPTLERIRAEDWRVILDEAQDTDPQQFAVLVEITRPSGAERGTWPAGGGEPPRPGRFCMVGDAQQSIYGSRADIRNFSAHLDVFARGAGGERLTFSVTFRAPERAISLLNATLPAAFGSGREHNLGLPPADGAPAPRLQVTYEPLAAGPHNEAGAVSVLPLPAHPEKMRVEARLAVEARALAVWLVRHGPAGVGARSWGEICILAPRNDWLLTVRRELEAAHLRTALQMRKNRSGDNPAYAWTVGLLAAVCDPANTFEWVGVLREVFAVSDALLALELRSAGGRIHPDDPERHAEPLRSALATLQALANRVDAEGVTLADFAHELIRASGLEAKARAADASGGLAAELSRLAAGAAELGLTGAGPREWLAELLAGLESGRPSGRPEPDAINLLTAHSTKGLEWPVVIPVGLWRKIGKYEDTGFRLVEQPASSPMVYFDGASLPDSVRESRERERQRELVRLLYVTLTRAKRNLVLPWAADFGAAEAGSFLELWGADLATLPLLEAPSAPADGESMAPEESTPPLTGDLLTTAPVISFPRRVLPHQLAGHADVPRGSLHESGTEQPAARDATDPLAYGTWWHLTMEFLPWSRQQDPEPYLKKAMQEARLEGFGERAARELDLLLRTDAWQSLRAARWQVQTEVSLLAPHAADAWVDGVVDLVAHDQAAGELLVVDWKTNQLRPGESPNQLLDRLKGEYEAQLGAYQTCLAPFFTGQTVRLALYATTIGQWVSW